MLPNGMLTQTSENAIRALVFLGLQQSALPTAPRVIAQALGCSPTYLMKTLQLLVRAGILRSRRGAHGGVWLGRAPKEISLRNIVEACQGTVVANYCQSLGHKYSASVCAFHQAMQEVFDATTASLSRWTLADLIRKPAPAGGHVSSRACKLQMVMPRAALKQESSRA